MKRPTQSMHKDSKIPLHKAGRFLFWTNKQEGQKPKSSKAWASLAPLRHPNSSPWNKPRRLSERPHMLAETWSPIFPWTRYRGVKEKQQFNHTNSQLFKMKKGLMFFLHVVFKWFLEASFGHAIWFWWLEAGSFLEGLYVVLGKPHMAMVKNTGYPKNPIGKRKNKTKTCGPLGFPFWPIATCFQTNLYGHELVNLGFLANSHACLLQRRHQLI